MRAAFKASSFKNSSSHLPRVSDIQAKGLRKDQKENTQELGLFPKKRKGKANQVLIHQSQRDLHVPPDSPPPLIPAGSQIPTLKEFSLAKFKIMSLLSLVVLVASNTWEERPQSR